MKIFYKLISLNNLAIYWNSNTNLISDLVLKNDILSELQLTIATKFSKPDNFKYGFFYLQIKKKILSL